MKTIAVLGATLFACLTSSEPSLAKLTLTDESGIAAAELPVALTAGNEWQTVTVETPTLINAGNYRITLNLSGPAAVDSLTLM
jgi:hypothetical protein